MRPRGIVQAFLAVFLLSAGCMPAFRPEAMGRGDIGSGQVVVVGKFVLDPPMTDEEQNISGIGSSLALGKAWLLMGAGPWEGEGEPGFSDYSGGIETLFGEYFFTIFDEGDRPYVQMATYNVDQVQRVYLPADLKLQIMPGDEVVYVGTWKFKRDEFNSFKGLQILDQSQEAAKAIRDRFGKIKVVKRLPTVLKRPSR